MNSTEEDNLNKNQLNEDNINAEDVNSENINSENEYYEESKLINNRKKLKININRDNSN